jgi:CRISPR-associated endonuclease Csn1
LEERLNEFSGDAKKAFSNLEENPIWLNKEKGISIKRVAVKGIRNGVPLHTKKDKDGRVLLDSFGNPQLTDFIDTDNNHHVAIYQDEYGKLQEKVVSFLEVILRKTQGLPSVDKDHNKNEGWEFLFSVKKNEYFVFPNAETGFDPKIVNLMDPDNYVVIAPNLFRVQTISTGDYRFRHHFESTGEEKKNLKGIIYKRLSLSFARIAVKVRVDHIGRIVSVGEY